jgi:mannose-6-phosphate isomerase-like protein (cupin superfamily)
MEQAKGAVRVITPREWGPNLPLTEGEGAFRPLVWPKLRAYARSLHHIRLAGEAATVPLRHASEAVYYVVEGTGEVIEPGASHHGLTEGSMIHIGPGTTYQFRTRHGVTLIGGPCPADPGLYR